MSKKLSNSFATGGGGFHFEAHVQASFVTLMLSGGYAPCLPCWPITKVKLQGKIDGFDTDDLIVYVDNAKEQRKLLGQVKHSIAITEASALFGEVMQAAWNDFNNPNMFTKGKDVIALITGPLNATDAHNVLWLLSQAKHTPNVDEFFRNVRQGKFSPPKSSKKLDVIRHHLKAANNNNDISDSTLYEFLNHFHLLSYDLGHESGVALSLLHSHISQFQQQNSQWIWARIVDLVQTWNQDAGTISPDKIPDDLKRAFRSDTIVEMPTRLNIVQDKPKTDWTHHADATCLALIILVGAWQDKNENDIEIITRLLDITYDEWLKKARELLHCPDSPLSLKDGIWKVVNRTELWSQLGSRILDQNLNVFTSLAISVLKEPDPSFELPVEERYAASIHGKVLKYSPTLRKGIAEGLAILSNHPDVCDSCSRGQAEASSVQVIHELLTNADGVLWGSLNPLLPTLAEVAPGEFLNAIEKAMRLVPCPFDELFSQEGSGITGRNYLTGLLWALEGMAWDEQYLVRACVALGDLASHDSGGQWGNRPSNSLVTILLPWFPQTLASADKCKVAVETLFREQPDIGWNLIIQLLPNRRQTSSGSYKPQWRNAIPDDYKKDITNREYWQQVSSYANLAVNAAGQCPVRISTLIDCLGSLPKDAFDQLFQKIGSRPILDLPEEQRLLIWNHLTTFAHKHRRFSDAEWALPDELIIQVEQAAEQLVPSNPFYLHQQLFSGNDYDLYEENGNWEEQRREFDKQRETAIKEIFEQYGVDGVIQFAESVSSPEQVGYALGVITDSVIEQNFFPHFLNVQDRTRKALVSSFIRHRFFLRGWEWCRCIDKSSWIPEQIGEFLSCLPFTEETWGHVTEWLGAYEVEYWTRSNANAYQAKGNLALGIEKLIEYGRPYAAIDCLGAMLHDNQQPDATLCVQALRSALSSKEPCSMMARYHIVELIKFLQAAPLLNLDDIFEIEWNYLPLLEGNKDAVPKFLESRLANDPEFFCEAIRLSYRTKKEDPAAKESSAESAAIASNVWRLFHNWKTPPGTQQDGIFNGEQFTAWVQRVKETCAESGHLEVALIHIGEVLIHVPSDPDGLWIHRAVGTVLNDRENDKMRDGYRIGTYNSRGIHWVDPTGKPERELANQFRSKAEAVENAGFQRFAVILRDLADGYEREAERIIAEHKQKDE